MSDSGASTTKLLDLLGELIHLPPEEQAARLAELSTSDADRARLEKWLRLRDGSDSFLERTPSLVLRTIRPALSGAGRMSESGFRCESADPAQLRSMAAPSVAGYEVKELLGQGGMGTVWRAVQAGTGREVALKVMEPLLLASPRARLRFERELRLAARLRHPHIARVYDGGSTGSVCYNVMELIDGVPLDGFVESHRLSQRQILQLMIRVCHAVTHAHQNAVIHRDLKPSNILVDKEGEPHLLDFGLARALEEATADGDLLLTVDGDLAGTPAYMSPEQASGTSALDTRTDVYSLGVILYRLLSGRSPHELGGSRMEVLRRIAEEEPLAPRAGPRRIDRLLEAILLRTLARAPEDRYASVADFANDLGAYLNGEAVAASPPSRSERLRRLARKNRVGLSITFAFAAVLVAATAVSTWQAVRATKFGAAALVQRDLALRAQAAEAAQRKAAEQARAQTEWINQLLSGMTASVDLKDLNRIRQTRRADTRPLASADVLSELADQLRGRGRVVEAEPLSLEALRQDAQAGNTTGINVLYHWAHHAQILDAKGDRDGAEQWMAKTLAEARREFPQPNRLLGYAIYYTAVLLNEHGKYAQAEQLAREVRDLRDRHPEIDASGGGDEATAISLEQIYTGLGDRANAQRWAREIRSLLEATLSELAGAVRGNPYDASKPALRGSVYGRLGRFREAAEDYKSAIGLHPADPYAWVQLMAALLGADDRAEYQRVRHRSLGVSVPESDTGLCAAFARASLIVPAGGPELDQAVRIADGAAQVSPSDPWCCFTEGLARYRKGDYGPTVVWLSRSLRQSAQDDRRDAMSELFIGMAFEHLGRHSAAQVALRRGNRIVETTVQRAGEGDLGRCNDADYNDNFQDTVFAHLARAEAEAMFSAQASEAASAAAPDLALPGRASAEVYWAAQSRRRIDVLSELLCIRPDDAAALTARGEVYAESGSFTQAAADCAAAARLNPEDSRAIRHGLPLFLLCGDMRLFSEVRAQDLRRMADGDAMMTVCSLLSSPQPSQLDAAASIAEKLVAAKRTNAWNCLARGLAEYRRGHYAEAATWLTAADSDENVTDDRRLACSRFFLAMAQSRQGKPADARANFEIGSELLQRKRVKPQERELTDSTAMDWLLCQCASKEAQAMIRVRSR